jgi:Beta-galactosidase/beta-glucuronidase
MKLKNNNLSKVKKMKQTNCIKYAALINIVILIGSGSRLAAENKFSSQVKTCVRERLFMDFGWRFALGHANDAKKDFNYATGYFSYFAKAGYGDGPASKDFDDRPWRMLNLPHDWAVELPFDSLASYSHGYKAIGRNYPATSIGWYRKIFTIPESDLGRRMSIEFDGVHRNSVVWINGFYLGQEHSGYCGFQYDVTDYINYGGENVIAVRVDATMEEGWYYEGAGIYRHVWLNKTSPLHITPNGTFVSSEIKDHAADITTRTTIINEGKSGAIFDINQTINDAKGKAVTTCTLKRLTLSPGAANEFFCLIPVANPKLWSVDTPYLYKLITTVHLGDSLIDQYETPFGLRTLRFDSKEGFFLNGQHLLLKGTNNHQDHAGVGTAIPDALQEFRIKRLKEMGSNAYRCSHNPPTPELLDACDRLGILVIDENRLTGTNNEHFDLLKRIILRDRNHPSVFVWSIGNEEWDLEGNITGARIASTMQAFVRRLDPTRRITYANSGGWGNGISTVQDVMGFNYIFNGDIDKQHADFPGQPSIGTEETTSRSTRGVYEDDIPNAHLAPIDRTPPGHGVEEGLKFYAARPFLSGLFFWTGFDYRGEPHPFGWPQVTSQSGIVDLCGFPKDMFYYLKSWWTDEPVLHIFPHWNWKGKEGQGINVWVYSNCDEVELFLDTKSLGRKTIHQNSHLEWMVNYKPGTLLARGYKNGKEIIADKVETTGESASIKLTQDRSTIKADGEDVSVVTIQISDSKGRCVPTAENEIAFSLQGPGKIIGLGNGDPSSHEPDRYFERISHVNIDHLKAQTMPPKNNYPETNLEYNDSAWQWAVNGKGEYVVTLKDSLDVAIIRGEFNLPALTENASVSLWPKSLGEEQAMYVNGHLVAKNIKRNDPVQKYKLDHSFLREGKNIYAIVGTPLVKKFRYDNLNIDPGIIQVCLPEGTPKRKVFHGLAQVIVQSTKDPGEIILTAMSESSLKATLKLRTQITLLTPAVPAE